MMTKNVVTIDMSNTVYEACQRYQEYGVGCLVVMNNDLIVGILTERDMIERVIIDQKDPKKTPVEEIMSRNIKTIHASAKVEQAAEMMKTHRIKKLPVVLNNKIVGIVTATDLANLTPNFARTLQQLINEKKPVHRVAPVP